MKSPAGAALAFALHCSSAWAEPVDVGVDQLAVPSAGERVLQGQIGDRDTDVRPQQPGAGWAGRPADQSSQVSRERPSAQTPVQLNPARRTAEPAPPLSTVRQGRDTRVSPLSGSDRCDPREAAALGNPLCARVLETRAREFERPPAAPLTAEQRLLAGQRNLDRRDDTAQAARRLAKGNADLSLEDQGVAATTLGAAQTSEPTGAEQERASELKAIADAITAGVTNGITVLPPNLK